MDTLPKLLDGSGPLARCLEVGDEQPNEIVPMIDRFVGQVPKPCSRGFLEVELDELHGCVASAVVQLYRCQIVLYPGLGILRSIVLGGVIRELELVGYPGLLDGVGETSEAESFVIFGISIIPPSTFLASPIDSPLSDVVACFANSCRPRRISPWAVAPWQILATLWRSTSALVRFECGGIQMIPAAW